MINCRFWIEFRQVSSGSEIVEGSITLSSHYP
ncbi:hypothetical protein F383_08800 [Gossypium arboreum]|uniref:Uncharacterized protein n=1 Tax=Gossypium arboreum TaxID=29729 RepID=A0A0B0PFU3_GOSAR|nr:hypothetical protein F383_08800 [Gossypium arboreum]